MSSKFLCKDLKFVPLCAAWFLCRLICLGSSWGRGVCVVCVCVGGGGGGEGAGRGVEGAGIRNITVLFG